MGTRSLAAYEKSHTLDKPQIVQTDARGVAPAGYRAAYEGLGLALGEFDAWIAANGHTPASDLREY